MSNLLDLATQDITLRRATSTGRGEYCGPCPDCGGRDRFRVWPEEGRYWCRQCGKRGDAIQYLRDFHGLGFIEAKRALGMDTSPASRQAQAIAKAHRAALVAAREAYDRWQREKLITLSDGYRKFVTEYEITQIGYRASHRCSDLYSESDRSYWTLRLTQIYDRLAALEYSLDLLTFRKFEAERFSWWQGEVECERLAA